MSRISERNWSITYTGALAVLLLSLGFLWNISGTLPYRMSLILAGASGLVFAITSRIAGMERFRTFGKPLSGFLAMISGTLLVAALALFASTSVEQLTGIISQGGSIVQVARSVMITVIGMAGLLLGTYLTITGSSLVIWDRLDSKVPVGPGKSDLVFTAILAGITLFSIFGRSLIKDIPVMEYIETTRTVLITSDPLSGTISGLMLIITYIMFGKAWSALPIRESVPRQQLEIYDRLAWAEKFLKWLLVPVIGIATAITDFADIEQLQTLLLFTSEPVRSMMVRAMIISILIVLAVKLLQLVTGDRRKLRVLAPYVVFGAVAYIGAPYLTGIIDMLVSILPSGIASQANSMIGEIGERNVVMAMMTLASGASFMLKTMMGLLRGFGIIPRGLEGTTLAATGVFMTSIGVHIFDPRPTMMFTGVALSMVIWEIGKRSTVLGREVGRSGSSLQAETVQAVTKLAIAAVAILIARTVLIAVQEVDIGIPQGPRGLLVFILAAMGVTLLAFSLREYT